MKKIINNDWEVISFYKKTNFSKLYKIRNINSNEPGLIKIFNSDGNIKKHFSKSTFQIVSSIKHRNCIELYDLVEIENNFGILMEFFEGEPINSYKDKPFGEKLKLIIQICNGLDILHENGIVHRDMKPENVLVNHQGEVKITDFDFVKVQKITCENDHFRGTVKYSSPEQCIHNDKIDQRSDLYSLGIILYELIYGKLPFVGRSWIEIADKQIKQRIKFPDKKNISPSIKDILVKLLAKDRKARFQNARDLAIPLNLILNNSIDLVQASSSYLLPPSLVGRKKILSKITENIHSEQLTIISGKEGIGKTALLEKVCEFSTGFDIIKFDLKIENRVFIEQLLAETTLVISRLSSNEQKKILKPDFAAICRFYKPLKKYFNLGKIKEENNINLIFYKICILIEKLSQKPLLVIDSFERIDILSLRLIGYILENPEFNFRILVTINPFNFENQDMENRIRNIIAENSREIHSLSDLNLDQTRLMINSMLGSNDCLSDFVFEKIYFHTSGNPLFIEKLITYFYQKRYLLKKNQNWTLHESTFYELSLPNSFKNLIIINYQNLSSESKKTLHNFIFLNLPVSEEEFSEIFDSDEKRLFEIIYKLKTKFLLSQTQENTYFVSGAVNKTIIEKYEINPSIDTINRIYQFINKIKHRKPSEIEKLVTLGKALKKWDDVIDHLELLKSVYMDNLDYAKAAIYIRQLIEIKEIYRREKCIKDYLRLAKIIQNTGEKNKAESNALISIKMAEQSKDYSTLEKGYKFLTWHYFLEGKLTKSIEINKKNIELTHNSGNVKLLAQNIGNMGNLYFEKKEYDIALNYFHDQMKISKNNDMKADYVKGIGNIANIHLSKGELAEAEDWIQRMLNECKKCGLTFELAIAHGRSGALYLKKDEFENSLNHYKKKLELLKNFHQLRQEAATYQKIAYLNQLLGNNKEALSNYYNQQKILLKTGNFVDRGGPLRQIGNIYKELKLFKKSEDTFFEALPIIKRKGNTSLYIKTLLELGDLYLIQNRLDESRQMLQKAKNYDNSTIKEEIKIRIDTFDAEITFLDNSDLREKIRVLNRLSGYLLENDTEAKNIKKVLFKYISKDWFKGDTGKTEVHSKQEEQDFSPDLLQMFLNLINPETAYLELMKFLVEKCHADNCQIVVFDQFEKKMKTLAVSPNLLEEDLDFSETILHEVMLQSRPIYSQNAVDSNQFQDNKSILGKVFLSVISVPLNLKFHKKSALYIDRRNIEFGAFTENDLQRVISIAKLISPILDKSEEFYEEHIHSEINKMDLMIGNSKKMIELFKNIYQAARYNLSVLITGESGTGKDLVAQAIHKMNPNRKGEYIAVNCAAIPESLAESTLFGHEKGTFTGASTLSKGKFELAQKGTLFLDEIAELPFNLQSKFLRILEDKQITRLGGTNTIKLDIRIITATHKDLISEVEKGNFRNDLFHRLSIFPLHVPPLRDRKEDIPVLAMSFMEKFSQENNKKVQGFSSDAIAALVNYDWRRNNVRELKNVIGRSMINVPENTQITAFHLFPEKHISLNRSPLEYSETISGKKLDEILRKVEAEVVYNVLQRNNWKKSKTALEIGISRPRLDKIIKQNQLKKL